MLLSVWREDRAKERLLFSNFKDESAEDMLCKAESMWGRLSSRSAGRDKGSQRQEVMEAGRGTWILSSTRRTWDLRSMLQPLGTLRRVVWPKSAVKLVPFLQWTRET